jgi:hypothetical protein
MEWGCRWLLRIGGASGCDSGELVAGETELRAIGFCYAEFADIRLIEVPNFREEVADAIARVGEPGDQLRFECVGDIGDVLDGSHEVGREAWLRRSAGRRVA